MSSTPFPRTLYAFVSLLTILLLAGCGGGDKSSPSSLNGTSGNINENKDPAPISDAAADLEAPVLVLTPQPIKTFRFTWDGVSGATSYNLLEDPDGNSGYSVIAAFGSAIRSYDHEVFLPGRINARYVLEACNDDGCTDSAPVNVTGTLAEAVGYFKAPDNGRHKFGASIAFSGDGNVMAVGDPVAGNGGVVYVFSRVASGLPWKRQADVTSSDTRVLVGFGNSVALSVDGDTLAVGAPYLSRFSDGGVVYVFTRQGSGGQWQQQASMKGSKLNPDYGELGDEFGASIALSGDGDTLAVGSPGFEGSSDPVYVFIRNGTTWRQETSIEGEYERFGTNVALASDGNTLAVTGFFPLPVDVPDDRREVVIFVRSGSHWTEQTTLQNPDFYLGMALAGDGNTLSVGAIGSIKIFTRNGSVWNMQADIKSSKSPFFNNDNIALSADGNTLAVSADDSSNATGVNGDQTDTSASLSGAVFLFTRSGDNWTQQAYIKASNTNAEDFFGNDFFPLTADSLALAADGNTLAVGAVGEDSNAIDIGGNQADNSAPHTGAVYLY